MQLARSLLCGRFRPIWFAEEVDYGSTVRRFLIAICPAESGGSSDRNVRGPGRTWNRTAGAGCDGRPLFHVPETSNRTSRTAALIRLFPLSFGLRS